MIKCPYCAQNIVASYCINDSSGYPERKSIILRNTDNVLMIQNNFSWVPLEKTLLKEKNKHNTENSLLCIRCGFEATVRQWFACSLKPYDFGFEEDTCVCGGDLFLEPIDLYSGAYGWSCDICGMNYPKKA